LKDRTLFQINIIGEYSPFYLFNNTDNNSQWCQKAAVQGHIFITTGSEL
jgi:hypothetical protein